MKFAVFSIFFGFLSVSNAFDLESCQIKSMKRLEMQVISLNISNVETTRTPEGGPYHRQILVCNERACEFDRLTGEIKKYQPGHSDADQYGIVRYPDINLMEEISNMKAAAEAYNEAEKNCP